MAIQPSGDYVLEITMLKYLTTSAALLIGAPLYAQSMDPAADPATMPSGTPAASDQTMPEASGSMSGSSSPATAAPGTSTSGADPVATAVASEWPKYDAAGSGSLTKTAFQKWISDLYAQANRPAPEKSYFEAAFAQADKDKSGGVSKMELENFLRG
jgi:hypothetical protein